MNISMLIEDRGLTKCIAQGVTVLHRYRLFLGDNGETGDNYVALYAAPDAKGDEWVYLETNGGPVVVGGIDDDGEIVLCDAAEEWIGADDNAWLRELLEMV